MTDGTQGIDAETLADLSHKLVDQVALYGMAAGKITDAGVRAAVQTAKEERAQLLQNVTAKMWLSDMSLVDQATRLGTARQAFERLHMSMDDAGILAEVLKGEDYLHERVTRATDDDRLSPHTRNYLRTVLSKIDTTREDIRGLIGSAG